MTRPSAVGQDCSGGRRGGRHSQRGDDNPKSTKLGATSGRYGKRYDLSGARGGYVAIDKTSGTVANPGIALGVAGAKGVASKNLYFGWGWGAAGRNVAIDRWWSEFFGHERRAVSGRQA